MSQNVIHLPILEVMKESWKESKVQKALFLLSSFAF